MKKNAENPFFSCTRFADRRAHLGISGSVSAYKAADLLRAFLKIQIRVSATLTEGAQQFITPLLIQALGAKPVYGKMFSRETDTFAHLEPGQNAEVFVIAPASANFMARLADGFADDMLSAQCLAFSGPFILAPAMNPRMWENAATKANAECLRNRGFRIVPPASGPTACGEEGQGRLADLQEIFLSSLAVLAPQDLGGVKAMVTLGPTREMWDGARFFSNASSGLMGTALATAAWLRGAEVYALCGPGVDMFLPAGVKRIDVKTAKDMEDEALKLWPAMNWGLFCAAVADFAPKRPEDADSLKIHKSEYADSFEITMLRNPDILAACAGMRKPDQKILGFAAEITPDQASLATLANAKLKSKQADIIAANRINPENGSFGAQESSMLVVDKNGLEESWGPLPKADIAWELLSWLLRL